MKQTNNAIKFLMAQYRAIFKNAYFKGLTSAVLLTAGMAVAGGAQAETYKDIADINALEGDTVTIKGPDDRLALQVPDGRTLDKNLDIRLSGNSVFYIKGSGTTSADGTAIVDGNGKNITITGKKDSPTFVFGSSKVAPKLKINNLGTLAIDGVKVNLTTPTSGTNSSGYQVGVDIGAQNVIISNGAQVTLGNNVASSGNKANTLLRGTNMLVEGEDTVVNIGTPQLETTKGSANTKAVFGYEEARDANDSVTTKGSDITVNDATLNLYGAVVKQNSDAKNPVLGGTKGYAALIQGKTLNMNNATLNVKASNLSGENGNYGGAGGILAVHKSTLTNSYLTIEEDASLNLQMREFSKDYSTSDWKSSAQGRDYNGSLTINGGVVVIDGVLRHNKGGLLEISDNTQLTGGALPTVDEADLNKSASKLNNAIFIGIYGDAANSNVNSSGYSGSFGNSTLATLRLSSTTLDQFLNSTDEVIKAKDGSTIKDQQGQLVVHHGARIELTDASQVEMSKFVFNNHAGAGHISTAISTNKDSNSGDYGTTNTGTGNAAIIGNPNDTNGQLDGTRTIFASNMSIGKTLLAVPEATGRLTQQVTSGNSSLVFRLEANDLTLGSEKGTLLDNAEWGGFDSANNTIGVYELKAHNSVYLIDGKGDTFYLQDPVELNRDFYTKDASGNYTTTANTPGLIKGDSLVIGKTTSGSLSITGGAWQNDARQSLTVASGSLSIKASAYDRNGDKQFNDSDALKDGINYNGTNNRPYYINGNPSSLTWNGAFVINGGNSADNAKITVSGSQGADATLDLRNASITWGSGAVTLSGNSQDISKTDPEASAGEGILYITGNQFNSFLGDGNTDTNGNASASQTKLNIDNDGVLFVDGPVTGDINFDKFTNVEDTRAQARQINFVSGAGSDSGAGTLYINGGISLVTGVDVNNNGSVDSGEVANLDIGNGTIDAQTIAINNNSIDSDDRGDVDVDKVTVAEGTLKVSSSLTSNNAVVEFGEGDSGAKLVLDTDGGVNSTGSVTSNLVFNGPGVGESTKYSLEVDEGSWALAAGKDITLNDGASFVVGTDNYDVRGIKASLTADNLYVAGTSDNNRVYGGSSATFNTLQAGTGAVFDIGGHLTINGIAPANIDDSTDSKELPSVQDAKATAGIDLTGARFDVNGAGAKFELGETATATLVTIGSESSGSGDNATTTTKVTVNDVLADASINLRDHGVFRLNFADNLTINAEAARQLKAQLLDSNQKGLLEVGKADLGIHYDDPDNLITSWDNVKDFVDVVPDVANDKLLNTLVNDVDLGTIVAGNFGAIQTNFSGPTQLQIDGDLKLHNARGEYFVFHDNNGTPEAIGVALASNSELYLEGAGKIGAISGTLNGGSDVTIAAKTDADGNVISGTTEVLGAISNIDDLSVENTTTVDGNVTANFLGLDDGISFSNGTHDMTFAEVYQGAGAEISTKNLTITGRTGNVLGADSVLQGTTTVADTLTIGDSSAQSTNNEVVIANGSVVADKLVMHSGSSLSVGYKAQDVDSDPNDGFDETVNYSGELQVNTADLNGASIIIDPVTSTSTAVASFAQFADAVGTNHDLYNAGTIDGNIFVGANSAAGIGTSDLADLRDAIAEYQNSNGALADYGALVVLDKNVAVADGNGITMTAQSVQDFRDYMSSTGNGKYFAAQVRADNTIANTLYFGADTAVIVHAEALNAQHSGLANAPTALVTFASNNAQLIADGGEILVNGQVRANRNYTFFKDGDGKVAVVDITGNTSGAGIDVYTENGFLYGEINNENGGTLELKVNDTRSLMAGASDPVYTTLVAYAQGYNGTKDTDTADGDQTDYLYNGYITQEVTGEGGQNTTTREKNLNYSNYFLDESIAVGNGAAAESVARLAIYGGAAQAAISAGASTYDAVSGRMGVGANGANITVADNTQGAALWLAPIYKSSDSDGFDAEGLDYGVDMDLYGVALGADYTLSNGIRFGAMFNVGSGDIDGQGAGSAVSNDFDYYGFAVYGGYSMGALSVVADVSYTVADNDLEGNTAIDKVGASLDSTNLSIGVTGQYQLDFNGTTVTPHAGLRFSRIDLDDYTIDGEDVIADYDADSMNIFSIPVGVTFAKEFTGDAWTVKPSLDLTLTGNFGDDETDGTVHWAGVENLSTNVSSEVIDNFTYGATLGVAAKTGNFSLGLGVNYTGSSNVDEFGVQANARFVF